jgi:hypothetical protein
MPGAASLGKATPGAASLGEAMLGAASLGEATPGAASLGEATPGAASSGEATPGVPPTCANDSNTSDYTASLASLSSFLSTAELNEFTSILAYDIIKTKTRALLLSAACTLLMFTFSTSSRTSYKNFFASLLVP